jgi:hypothetical protein
MSHHALYRVEFTGGRYRVEAGSAHGVTIGAQFTLYESHPSVSNSTPLGTLEVDDIDLFSSTLTYPAEKLPLKLGPYSVALQTGMGAEVLSLHVPLEEKYMPVFEALHKQMRGTDPECKMVSLVKKDKAMLDVVKENHEIYFNILDAQVASFGLSRMPFAIEPTVDTLHPILCGAAHYYRHLGRAQVHEYIQEKVKIEFTALERSKSEFDERGRPVLHPVQPNLYRNGMVEITIGKKAIYGIKLINETDLDLYPAAFYFNSSDMSISR